MLDKIPMAGGGRAVQAAGVEHKFICAKKPVTTWEPVER